MLFFPYRRKIIQEHRWVFAPNSNCLMKKMIKMVLDAMLKRCKQNNMLPSFIIRATSNMKSVTFDEVNSSKCPECCRKLAKILPITQLVFCWFWLIFKIIGKIRSGYKSNEISYKTVLVNFISIFSKTGCYEFINWL